MQDEFENVRCAIIKEDNKRRETSQGIVQQEGLSPVIPAYCTKSLTLKGSDFFHLTDIFPFIYINRMGADHF